MTGIHSQDTLSLPEIIERVGHFLAVPDLHRSIKVCRLWYHVLTPHLWTNIDDRIYSWPKILRSHGAEDDDSDDKNETSDWMRLGLAKRGRHIRHLHIQWRNILDAVILEPTCCQLESLTIGNLGPSLKIMASEYPWMQQVAIRERRQFVEEHRRQAMNGPFIRPDLTEGIFSAGVFTAKNTWRRTLAQQELDWLTTQQFWLFLRSINATTTTRMRGLRELHLDGSLESFFDQASTDFFCDTLARFEGLEILENNYIPVGLDRLFSILPKLKHFRRFHTSFGGGVPQQPYPHINILELDTELATRTFYAFLLYLPNLDQLRFRGFQYTQSEITAAGVEELLEGTPSRLTHLCIDGTMSLNSNSIQIALRWLPNLTHITFGRIYPNVALTIGLYCKHIQHICEPDKNATYPFQTRQPEVLTLKNLFQSCKDLQSFDGMFQMVSLSSLTAIATTVNTTELDSVVDYDDDEAWTPWVCDRITQLRCQIGKLVRLTGPEQELYDKISAPRYTARVPKGRHLTVTLKHELSIAQHGRMYEYLARLSCLTVLDVGYEVMARRRASMEDNSSIHSPSRLRIERYLEEFSPVPGTLLLTLESGLGRLAALESLEVFGFEGIDHRMGKAEIEWMATAWPRLKVLRGLQQDYLPRIEYERRKDELRTLMEVLRPDVRHESIRR